MKLIEISISATLSIIVSINRGKQDVFYLIGRFYHSKYLAFPNIEVLNYVGYPKPGYL